MPTAHYALVEKEGCRSLQINTSVTTTIPTSTNPVDKNVTDGTVRSELEEIYLEYANIYPNPKLLEEKRHRETLLTAARAASTFQHLEKNDNSRSKKKTRKGFFTFLFGSRDEKEAEPAFKTTSINRSDDNDDNWLTYRDTTNDVVDDESLCGTMKSLDVSCIPPEVYSTVRSHLTSTRMRRENPNSLKWGPGSYQMLSRKGSESEMFVVVGLGEIAEFGGSVTCMAGIETNESDELNSTSRVLCTSDREELLRYEKRMQQFELCSVRGTVLSQNCIAVSWGFNDGITVFYRRQITTNSNGKKGGCWEAFWWLRPSESVLESMTNNAQDLFLDNQEQPGSPLLCISDCVALHVDIPTKEPLEEEGSIIVTLVITRMGGYIELVPLPTGLWKGPILVSNNFRKKQQRHHHHHYANGNVIASPSNTIALTTLEYQLDIQTLEVFRTSINSETIWNNHEYPEGPPAEFLLCTSGRSIDNDFGETMTFWAISTIFSSNEATKPAQLEDTNSFQIYSRLLEAVWTNTGPPVTSFATPEITSKWRTPREIELKNNAVPQKEEEKIEKNQTVVPVTTLTTTAPIVSMQLSNANESITTNSGPFLSILDWNGGVQIFDCSTLARLAAQNLTQLEYDQYRNNDRDENQNRLPLQFVKRIVLRTEVAIALNKVKVRPSVGNIHWLENSDGTLECLPPLVCILNNSRILAITKFDLSDENVTVKTTQKGKELYKLSVTPSIFPAAGAAIGNLEDNTLSFVTYTTKNSKPSTQKSKKTLNYFVMEKMQPVAIIETLARESKYREAIQSAENLPEYERNTLAEVVTNCYRKLWETDWDIDSLKATNDDPYIVGEAISIYESGTSDQRLTTEKLRFVLGFALDIVTREKEKEEETILKIRKYLVRLGTYELLCGYFHSEISMKKYRNEFKELSLSQLSLNLAEQGEIMAITIILFRHRIEIYENLLSILAALPLPLSPTSFCHLLPILDDGIFSDYFFDSVQCISKLPWSHMPQYISETTNVSTVLENFDEIVVLEYNTFSGNRLDDRVTSEAIVMDWFVKRAKRAQAFVGNVGDVIKLCQFGLQCSSPCLVGNPNPEPAIPQVQELHKTLQTSLTLRRMLLDRVISIDGDSINTDDLMNSNFTELLNIVLGCCSLSSDILYRFREYIQPLVMEIHSSSSNDNLDEAFIEFCLNEVAKYNNFKSDGAKRGLASVLVIAKSSKSSIHKSDRLIKKKAHLIRMVLSVITTISKNLNTASTADNSLNDSRELIGTIWSLYECLPARLMSSELDYELELQGLYQDLVGLDVISRWPGCEQPFAFFNKRQNERKSMEQTREKEYGDILEICKSFITVLSFIPTKDGVPLFWDLLCDIRSLNEVCFGSSLDIPNFLCKHVIPVLLEKGYFGIIASYLGSDVSDIDRKEIQSSVLDYVDETIVSENDNNSRILDAIKCQDILEPLLPSVGLIFQSNRRLFEASRFIMSVLFDGTPENILKPYNLKKMNELDVIETVLRQAPECIVHGCSQWNDSTYAQEANKQLRQACSTDVIPEENGHKVLPDLPGGGVFHLATILGLESRAAVLMVKNRVIFHALQLGFYGAAASIARTLVLDRMFGLNVDIYMDNVILNLIADVISIKTYEDHTTKKELCQIVLSRFTTKLTGTNSEAFSTIVQISSDLDRITSRFNHEFDGFSPERKACLLSRPVARLYDHIYREYEAMIHFMFIDLGNQTSKGLTDDSLMNALSRFILYWCIHDSKIPIKSRCLRDRADFQDNLFVGCALILQMPVILTGNKCVEELQKIAHDQATSVDNIESFGAENMLTIPDLDIVKKLVERGFSDNAARRAAISTRNSGYIDALRWAAQHTMNPVINNPLYILKQPDKKYVDEGAIILLQNSLIEVSRILKDSSLLKHVGNSVERETGPRKLEKVLPSPVTHESVNEKQGQRAIENISLASSNDINQRKLCVTASVEKRGQLQHQSMSQLPTRSSSKNIILETDNGEKEEITKKSVVDRHELRKKGQMALEKLRSSTSIAGSRQRLIKEGRLLLDHSKPLSQVKPQKAVKTAQSSEQATTSNTDDRGRLTHLRSLPKAQNSLKTDGHSEPTTTQSTYDRRRLTLQRGQAALEKLHDATSKIESRERLIGEGRLLLNQSKPLLQTKEEVKTAVLSGPATTSNTADGVNTIDQDIKNGVDDDSDGWNFDDF